MTKHTIIFKSVSARAGEKTAVTGANISVSSGELVLLIGANGSGKSTFVNAFFGHPRYSITDGEVLFDGENITGLSTTEKARKGMFLSMQHLPEVPGVTLFQFLYRAHKALTGETISAVAFHKKIILLAEEIGLKTDFLDKEINHKLSGGEKKQSELLQLAVLSPKFAFLDEIDSGVDVEAVKAISKTIEHLRKGGTGFLVISHNPNIGDDLSPDRIYHMEDGTIKQK